MNVAYRRVSTVNNNQKTERQLFNIGVVFDREYEDHASGTKRTSRPQLEECLASLVEGDTLYIHSIDRLARNTADLLNITQSLLDKGVGVRFIKEGLNVGSGEDPMAKAMGAMLLSVLGAVHTFQATMIQESVKEGMKVAKAKGTKFGAANPKYKVSDKSISRRNRQEAVQRIQHLREPLTLIRGMMPSATLKEVAGVLTERKYSLPSGKEGVWSGMQVKRVLDKLQIV